MLKIHLVKSDLRGEKKHTQERRGGAWQGEQKKEMEGKEERRGDGGMWVNLGGRKRGEGLQQKGFARPRVYGCRILPAHPRPHLRMQTAGTQPEPSRDWGPAAVGRALGHQTVSSAMHTGARQQATSTTKDIIAELGPVSTSNKHQQA